MNALTRPWNGGADQPGIYVGEARGALKLSSPLGSLVREKRWAYVCISSENWLVSLAVVDLGFAANAFYTAVDLESGKVAADGSVLGVPVALARVAPRPSDGLSAKLRTPGGSTRVSIERPLGMPTYRARVFASGFELDADLDPRPVSPVAVLGEWAPGRRAFTLKSALMKASGQLRIGSESRFLVGATAGMDFTQGWLPRETLWRWAFSMGRLEDGTPFGLNLSDANHLGDVCENVAWIGGVPHTLGPVRFEYDAARREAPWCVRSGDGLVDLCFEARGAHAEARNLGLVRSDFTQLSGWYSGVVAGRRLARAPGIAEHQAVKW